MSGHQRNKVLFLCAHNAVDRLRGDGTIEA